MLAGAFRRGLRDARLLPAPEAVIQTLGFIAAIVLPFMNIPLILLIGQRRSSKDISLVWALGVWLCLLAMLPSALVSPDPVFKLFAVVNLCLFSLVVIQVLRFRQ